MLTLLYTKHFPKHCVRMYGCVLCIPFPHFCSFTHSYSLARLISIYVCECVYVMLFLLFVRLFFSFHNQTAAFHSTAYPLHSTAQHTNTFAQCHSKMTAINNLRNKSALGLNFTKCTSTNTAARKFCIFFSLFFLPSCMLNTFQDGASD